VRVLAALPHRYLKLVYLYFVDASHGLWKGQEHRRIAKILSREIQYYFSLVHKDCGQ